MPSILLFKRRWLAGSDDLVLPGFLLFLTHFILFIITTVFISSSHDLDKWSAYDPEMMQQLNANETTINLVKCAKEIRDYSFIFVALLISAILMEIILTGFSMQGTVTNSEPRKPVAYIMYTRSGLGVLEIIFSIAASVELSSLWGRCPSLQHILGLEVGIIVINFVFLIIVIMVTLCTFDSSGHAFYQLKMARNDAASLEHLKTIITKFDERSKNSWNRRLRRFCCCVRDTTNTNMALDEVSHLLRDFFKDIDVVPSDILAGMVLLRHKQQCIEVKKVEADNDIDEYFCGRPITNETKFVDPYNPEESANYENMVYYCYYAIAAYGSLLYLVQYPATGLCKLLDQCLCNGRCCCSGEGAGTESTDIEDGGCCGWETSAVTRSLNENIHNTVVVYVSWKNNLYEQPFFVCIDFEKSAVVVTIRGTLSEMDALTDVVATPQLIDVDGNDGTWKAHKGILCGADYLRKRLLDDGILENAFSHDPSRDTNNFQLIILGHSLGAGIAAILSILLRPKYPQLVCYSYSPPGGLLSRSAVAASRHYINTVVYGKDLIIRTGIRQLLKMRLDMINLIRKSDIPKYKIIFGNPCQRTHERHSLFSSRNSGETLLASHPEMLAEYEDLYPPGRILHIVYKSLERGPFCVKRSTPRRSYYAVEANNEEDFGEILISHNMVTHHLPQELLKAMKKVLHGSLPSDDTIKYSQAQTIPSHAQTPANQNQSSNVTEPNDVILSMDPISDPTNHTQDTRGVSEPITEPANQKQDRKGSSEYTLEKQLLTTTPTITITSETALGAVATTKNPIDSRETEDIPEKNSTSNNNKDQEPINPQIKVLNSPNTQDTAMTSSQDEFDGEAPELNRSASLLGRFQDYMSAVLTDSNEEATSRFARSHSMPPRPHSVAIDKNTLERAKFEPNLIPKPPRSNSMRQPPNVKASRDYASAPPSRTSAPSDVTSFTPDIFVSADSIEFIDEDDVTDDAIATSSHRASSHDDVTFPTSNTAVHTGT